VVEELALGDVVGDEALGLASAVGLAEPVDVGEALDSSEGVPEGDAGALDSGTSVGLVDDGSLGDADPVASLGDAVADGSTRGPWSSSMMARICSS
jgi:hypothetical protein